MFAATSPAPASTSRWGDTHANEMDPDCRERFRLELTRSSVRVLVNGAPCFEQSGMASRYQPPDEFLRSDLHVYYTSWVNRPLAAAYRFHSGLASPSASVSAASPSPAG